MTNNHILELAELQDGKVIKRHIKNKPTITIGRNEDNDLVFNDSSISSFHAKIDIELGLGAADSEPVVFISDLGSTNGLQINHSTTKHKQIKSGDILTIAFKEFVIRINETESAAM